MMLRLMHGMDLADRKNLKRTYGAHGFVGTNVKIIYCTKCDRWRRHTDFAGRNKICTYCTDGKRIRSYTLRLEPDEEDFE